MSKLIAKIWTFQEAYHMGMQIASNITSTVKTLT